MRLIVNCEFEFCELDGWLPYSQFTIRYSQFLRHYLECRDDFRVVQRQFHRVVTGGERRQRRVRDDPPELSGWILPVGYLHGHLHWPPRAIEEPRRGHACGGWRMFQGEALPSEGNRGG